MGALVDMVDEILAIGREKPARADPQSTEPPLTRDEVKSFADQARAGLNRTATTEREG